jgi:hypothetical protein
MSSTPARPAIDSVQVSRAFINCACSGSRIAKPCAWKPAEVITRQSWPEAATAFLRESIPLQTPPSYQLVADELLRLHGLSRARSTVEAYVKAHLPHRILATEIDRQNASVHGPTKQIPAEVLHRSQSEHRSPLRPCPPASLLDLHFSLRVSRRVTNDHCIEFDGRRLQIAPTAKKYGTILFHPNAKLWVLEDAPSSIWPTILVHFSL